MSRIDRVEIESRMVPSPVSCVVITPSAYSEDGAALPVCYHLHGGGSSHEALVNSRPLFDALWDGGSMIPMVMVMANTTPLSFYLDEVGGALWETFISDELPTWLRRHYNVRTDQAGTVMTGVSMGGYGTLKIAFRHPDRFCAIAALEPAIEPGLSRAESPRRSRIYAAPSLAHLGHLLGDGADEGLYQANAPQCRLLGNADAVRMSGMRIYLECGDDDTLNLQDGAEYLHRLLWDLDISHEYHLVKDADHVGPSLTPRLVEALTFLSRSIQQADQPPAEKHVLSELGKAWMAWSESGMAGKGPEFSLVSEEGVAVLRAQFREPRKQAEMLDPTTLRRYAILPDKKV